jgi:hypothetical protein
MSKYTAQQIYALGQFIHANQRDFPDYHIGNQLRHLEYNAQRNLADASEDYFRKYLGTTVEKAMDRAAAVMNRKANPPQPASVQDNGAAAVRIIDLSQQGKPAEQAPNTLVAVGCGECGIRLSITLAELQEHGGAYCPKCITGAAKKIENLESAFAEFVQTVGTKLYPIQSNIDAMLAEINRRKITAPTADNFLDVFLALQPQLLGRLTEEDVRNMKSWEYEARLRIDPGMGGVDLEKYREGQPRGEASIHSSNKVKTFDLGARGISSQAGRA